MTIKVTQSRLLLATVATLLVSVPFVRADQMFLLNNYPTEQAGGALSGHFSVLDTAADDGLLTAGEVVNWAFTLTDAGAINTVTIDSTTTPNPDFQMFGTVQITATDILLPQPGVGGSNSIRMGELPAGIHDAVLQWGRRYDFDSGNVRDVYSGWDYQATPTSPDDVAYWSTSGPAFSLGGTDPWNIASVVPEPTTLSLLAISGLLLLRRRR